MKEDNNSMHRTRHLIQIVVSVLVMTMMGLTCHAENSQGQRPPFDPKRFEAELEQYITTHASLTPQEASKFFPVYRQMMKKQRALFDEMRRLRMQQTRSASCSAQPEPDSPEPEDPAPRS